jgi:hypothetical protein
MRSTKSFMVVILGLAMLAAPITASAAEHHHGARNRAHAAVAATRSFKFHNSVPARSVTPARWFAPRVVSNNRIAQASAWHQHRDFDDDDNFARNGGVVPVYPCYGYTKPTPAPVAGYLALAPALGYASPNYGSPCAAAQRAIKIARHDRRTGHPAAATDVLRNNSRALASCPGVAALPAYGSYGYNAPLQGSPSGYGASTMLAPLLQNFVR